MSKWWKFWEKREGYTDAIINAVIQSAEGGIGGARSTAALESAAGLYQAAFSAAKVNPEIPALGPSFLGEAARRLIRWGQAVYLIEISDGQIQLRDVASWTVGGGVREEDWIYSCELAGPLKTETIHRPSEGVVHFRYAVDPARPWEGLGPIQVASLTGTLAGAIEQRLSEEAGAPSALLLPIPVDGGDGEEGDPLANLKSDIAGAKGKPVLLRTTADSWGSGESGPQRDWVATRLGANPPEVMATLRKDSILSILSACQVPIALFSDADGTSQRESYRRFVMAVIEPLSQRMAEELSRKLEIPGIDFRFRSLWASDLVGRTQAFQRLVQSGMEIPEAAATSGIMTE